MNNGPASPPTSIEPIHLAIGYARRGWPVLPVHRPMANESGMYCSCGTPSCKNVGKHPATPAGLKDATLDEALIEVWFGGSIAPNIGVRAGRLDDGGGFIVLDIDPRNGGRESLDQLEATHGPLPPTPTEATGGGGLHYFFAHPSPDRPVKNSTGLWPGIDLKADGGYLVVAPSRHKSGGAYAWLPGRTPDDVELAPAPAWLLDAIKQRADGGRAPSRMPRTSRGDGAPGKVAEGGRNAHLTSIAGTLRRRGCDGEVVLAAVLAQNKVACQPPLDDTEVQCIVESVCRYPVGEWSIGKELVARQRSIGQSDQEVAASWELAGTAGAITKLEEMWTKGDVATPTGLVGLDDLLGGGLRPGNVVALAGAAGASKSALAGQVAYDASRTGAVVLVASVEMPPVEVHARWLALELFRQAPANALPLRFGDVFRGRAYRGECGVDEATNAEVRRRLNGAMASLRSRANLHVKHIPPGTTPATVDAFMKRLREKSPDVPALLIIDPVQRLYASESAKRRGRALDSINSIETERVSAVAQELKHMADAESVAVVFTSDTTKSAVLNHASSATSLRGSYELNHLATTVLGMYSGDTPEVVFKRLQAGGVPKPMTVADLANALPSWWGARADVAQLGPRIVALECSKNRQGAQRSFALGFIGGAMAFVERESTPAAPLRSAARREAVRSPKQ